jgi:tRNA1(Val) A37 N6-methylase TrmN6
MYTTKVDTIIFADCIYNEKGAIVLSRTITRLVKPGGNIIGVLPDYRVGVDVFENCMNQRGFNAKKINIVTNQNKTANNFVCSGGGEKKYCMFLWKNSPSFA